MRLPRRVPWASLHELEQVCSWVYAEENDAEGHSLAIKRLSAWKAVTHLPHALESTLSLLVVLAQDQSNNNSDSLLSLRQSYSAAIIRLVNGLVDPLQQGTYARSISSIASQIGFPLWLVELRHAATHEELPSLELLREAARESMTWLFHNYFLPTTNPTIPPTAETTLPPLEPVLKRYKVILKTTTRDASLRSQCKTEIQTIMRDVERWISSARVVANVATRGVGWETSTPDASSLSGEIDNKEIWALQRACDAFMRKGVLVPLSKKKRELSSQHFLPPELSVKIWSPLLKHLQDLHHDFYSTLARHIMNKLIVDSDFEEVGQSAVSDMSYCACLSRWVMWTVAALEDAEYQANTDLRTDLTLLLMRPPWFSSKFSDKRGEILLELLHSLCNGFPRLQLTLATLGVVSQGSALRSEQQKQDWTPEDIDVMEERLATLLSSDSKPDDPPLPRLAAPSPGSMAKEVSPGWRLLHVENTWQPCPIGVHFSAK